MNKVLILTQNLDTGGVQKSAAMLANALSKDYQCTIVLLEDDKSIEYQLEPLIALEIIPTIRVDIMSDGIGEKIFNYRLTALQTLTDQLNPDVIFSYEDYHNILALRLISNAKRIVSCRISLHNLYTKTAMIHLMPSDFYFEQIANLYPKANAVVCVSHFVRDEIAAIANDAKVMTIYNGVDQQYIKDTIIEPIVSELPMIVHVGRLHPQKGQFDLLNAFARIKDKILHRLVIIGDGILREELINMAVSLGIEDRVDFFGSICAPYQYMAAADIVVIPSYQEGFSNTVLEAMVCGGGVIATRYNGHDEIINDYGNVCDVGDVQGLSEIMVNFLLDRRRRDELKRNQFRDVESFEMTKSIKQYKKLIVEVIHG